MSSLKDKFSNIFNNLKNKASMKLMEKVLSGSLSEEQNKNIMTLMEKVKSGEKDVSQISKELGKILNIEDSQMQEIMQDFANKTTANQKPNSFNELSKYIDNFKEEDFNSKEIQDLLSQVSSVEKSKK